MKVLITGASGFLGKRVLALLVDDDRIKTILVVARHKLSHPSPKVVLLACDLMQPAAVANLPMDVDAVIHLAGLYDFSHGFQTNYLHNVLVTDNLLRRIQEAAVFRTITLHYASTYAVGSVSADNVDATLDEEPLMELPDLAIPYAHSKALAEQAVCTAGIPGAIFRLGVLVGDSQRGRIEKADGIYYVMRLLRAWGRNALGTRLRHMPIPAAQDGVMPLVPVDCAARVFVRSLFHAHGAHGPSIFGVYNSKSVPLDILCRELLDMYMPGTQPLYLQQTPQRVLRAQEWFTGVPPAIFDFAQRPRGLRNERFEATYADCHIPCFESYRPAFFQGFVEYMGEIAA